MGWSDPQEVTVMDALSRRPERLPGRWDRIDEYSSATEVAYRRGCDQIEVMDERPTHSMCVVKLKVIRPGGLHGVMARGTFRKDSNLFDAYRALVSRLGQESQIRDGEREAARTARLSHSMDAARAGGEQFGSAVCKEGMSLAVTSFVSDLVAEAAAMCVRTDTERIVFKENDPRFEVMLGAGRPSEGSSTFVEVRADGTVEIRIYMQDGAGDPQRPWYGAEFKI